MVRRIHRAKIKSWGRAGVPGGDLFLGKQMLTLAKGGLRSVQVLRTTRAAPPTSASAPSPPPLPGGVCRPGHVRGAGGGERRPDSTVRWRPRAAGPHRPRGSEALGRPQGVLLITELSAGLPFASREATVRPDPGQRLELPGSTGGRRGEPGARE